MRPPGFWTEVPLRPVARLLEPLARVYGAISAERMDRQGARVSRPVICIGNLTLGGAGKTPTALAVARCLAVCGVKPSFLTRGYGGRLPGPVVVDPQLHGAEAVGDEPLLLARQAPTIVARDRVAGALLGIGLGADAIVMDDGLQNPSLVKDLSLVVVDAGYGVGNGLVVPAGPLRAPLERQWRHAGGLVLIGEGTAGERISVEAETRGLPVHRARLVAGADFSGERMFAFAGIGRPQKFFDSLCGSGAGIAGTREFPDHHRYRAADLDALSNAARQLGASLVTTEKDWVRLPRDFAAGVRTLPVTLEFADPSRIRAQLESVVGSKR